MKALKECANGCGLPPNPPSKVLCKKCQVEVADGLQKLADYLATKKPTEFKAEVERTKLDKNKFR